MTTRRGFTLIELMVGLILMALVAGAVYKVLVGTQRAQRRQMEQSNLQENVRAGGLIVPAELRQIGYDSSQTFLTVTPDLITIAAHQVRFRAMRGLGFTCSIATNEIRIRKPMFGFRDPAPTDSLLLFVERNDNFAADDEWIPLAASAVNLTSTCGADPAIAFTLVTPISLSLMPSIATGGPVRTFEDMEFGLYTTGGRSWLGARAVATQPSYQPVLGPLADDSGFTLTYLDKNEAATANRAAVRTIDITLHGRSDQKVSFGSGAPQLVNLDLNTRVALRNNLRP